MKAASIYKTEDKGYIVFGLSKTISGFRIASEPFINISETEATIDSIANAIKEALCNDDSQKVPNPKDWKEFNRIFLQKIGLRSISELDNKKTKLVAVKEDKEGMVFEPVRFQDSPNKGFVGIDKDETIEIVVGATNNGIVKAYEFALSKCG